MQAIYNTIIPTHAVVYLATNANMTSVTLLNVRRVYQGEWLNDAVSYFCAIVVSCLFL